MLTPDLTYSFRMPKDTSGPTFEVFSRHGNESGTAVQVVFTILNLPIDRMLVLSNAVLLGIPGATQGVESLRVEGMTAAGLLFAIARFDEVLVADLNRELTWAGQVFLPGGGPGVTLVRATANFDAGVNSNQLIADFHGVVIPRANAAPF